MRFWRYLGLVESDCYHTQHVHHYDVNMCGTLSRKISNRLILGKVKRLRNLGLAFLKLLKKQTLDKDLRKSW